MSTQLERLTKMARRNMADILIQMVVDEEIDNNHTVADVINLIKVGAEPLKEEKIEPGTHNMKVIQQTATLNKVLEFADGPNKGQRMNINQKLDITPLEYAKDIPTEPGYYWVRWMGSEAVHSIGFLDGFAMINLSRPDRCSNHPDYEYYGPIPKPSTGG